MNNKNSQNRTNTLKKQGNIRVIINWYVITITKIIHKIKQINLKPTKQRKILKKLFNIISPSINYAKYYTWCLTFVKIYNIILNEKRKADVFISPD